MKKSLFFVALFMSGTALAQQPSSNSSANGAGAGGTADQNQMICRTIRETGSMLSRSRVCMTRAQWDEQRRQTRQNIDRAQTTRTNPGGN